MKSGEDPAQSLLTDKVVIRFSDTLVKGYTRKEQWTENWDVASASSPPVRLLDSSQEQTIPLQDAKAVFFVHSFQGTTKKDLRFHDDLDHAERLWVRIDFYDNEIVEGLIENNGDYLLREGFFLFPSDPEGNNWLIYVRKSQLRNFHVLGLRSRSAAKV